jgi:hypothetical protein
VVARPDLVGQPAHVLQREAHGPEQRVLGVGAVASGPVGPHQVRERVARLRRVGQQRVEVDLGEFAVVGAVEQPRVEHADDPAAAQVGDLAGDLAAEPLGGLEADEDELERTHAAT